MPQKSGKWTSARIWKMRSRGNRNWRKLKLKLIVGATGMIKKTLTESFIIILGLSLQTSYKWRLSEVQWRFWKGSLEWGSENEVSQFGSWIMILYQKGGGNFEFGENFLPPPEIQIEITTNVSLKKLKWSKWQTKGPVGWKFTPKIQ